MGLMPQMSERTSGSGPAAVANDGLPASVEPALFLGDAHPLVSQLGSTDGLVTLGQACSSLSWEGIRDAAGLRTFLQQYREELLGPFELTAIARAWQHASRGEVSELIALDQELAGQPALKQFAAASQRVGRSQLRRLRPLRDHRVVQRYGKAVDEARAHGWHTLVYGVTLAVYSLPIRQGLVTYSQQVLRGFVHAAIPSLKLSETEAARLIGELADPLPRLANETVARWCNRPATTPQFSLSQPGA
jgi:urease accessory protein